MFNKKYLRGQFCVGLLLLSAKSFGQGYIEMPETTQVPAFEKESMQLDLDVPPVRERDPDPLGGPRLNVKEFRLQGLVEFPELGITRASLVKRIEAIRFGLMKEDELGEWGYTEKEVGEIADLMADIEGDIEDQHVGTVEVQRLVFLIREQRRKRGVTLGMIENVADVITQFYREKGFILAKAYIPEQKVRDGIVTLTLLLGELGAVEVLNTKRVSNKLIERAFISYIDEPVTSKRLEEALYLVNDIPGLTARSVLSPGRQVGDTLLRLNTQNEKLISGNARIDNHGSDSTSKNRLYADVFIHNPSGLGDEVYLSVLKSYFPERSTYGAIRYNSFWGMPRLRTSIGYATNEFISNDQTQTSSFVGESKVISASIAHIFKRLRVKNYSAELSYSNIETELVIGTSGAPDLGTLDKYSLTFNFDLLNEKLRHVYIGNIGLNYESSSSTAEQGAEPIAYLSYELTMLSFFKVPFTNKQTRVLFNSVGQYSGSPMSNLNQLNLTGPTRARAFGINGFQADDAIFFSADWILGLPRSWDMNIFGRPLNKVLQPYLFGDFAYGMKHAFENSGEDNEIRKLGDVGMGLKVSHGPWNGRIFAASTLLDEVSNSGGDDVGEDSEIIGLEIDRSSFFAELSYSF